MRHLLDNIVWHTLVGPHSKYSAGTDDVRRYAQGFSPIVGFANPGQPNLDALAPYCEPGEHFYCADWSGTVPTGWQVDVESIMLKMVWEAPMPSTDEAPEALLLGPEHATQALESATLTHPGPFGPRTIELGEYFGYFEGDRLVAMAGERLFARLTSRDQWRLHASGFSRPRAGAAAHGQTDSPPDATQGDPVPSCDA